MSAIDFDVSIGPSDSPVLAPVSLGLLAYSFYQAYRRDASPLKTSIHMEVYRRTRGDTGRN
jgi:hypothetical protein